MAPKDASKYIALAVAAIIAFIMVGTYLVFKVRREEEKEKEREQRAAGADADSASKKPVVRKRIGETDAYQGRDHLSLAPTTALRVIHGLCCMIGQFGL